MDRRVEALERQYGELTRKVDHVSSEQNHIKELISQRFATIEKGQELVSAKVDGLSASIQMMASDPDKSPAGRMILKDQQDLQHDVLRLERDILELRTRSDARDRESSEFNGALKFASRASVSGLIIAILSVALLALKAIGVIP